MKHMLKKQDKQDNRTQKRKIGDLGELIATRFLMKQNYVILDRNYLKKYGEIDIVALKDGVYHFVEVKTVNHPRRSVIHETSGDYRPEDNVHPRKLQRLINTICVYLSERLLDDNEWRIDVITVFLDTKRGKASLNLIEGIIL